MSLQQDNSLSSEPSSLSRHRSLTEMLRSRAFKQQLQLPQQLNAGKFANRAGQDEEVSSDGKSDLMMDIASKAKVTTTTQIHEEPNGKYRFTMFKRLETQVDGSLLDSPTVRDALRLVPSCDSEAKRLFLSQKSLIKQPSTHAKESSAAATIITSKKKPKNGREKYHEHREMIREEVMFKYKKKQAVIEKSPAGSNESIPSALASPIGDAHSYSADNKKPDKIAKKVAPIQFSVSGAKDIDGNRMESPTSKLFCAPPNASSVRTPRSPRQASVAFANSGNAADDKASPLSAGLIRPIPSPFSNTQTSVNVPSPISSDLESQQHRVEHVKTAVNDENFWTHLQPSAKLSHPQRGHMSTSPLQKNIDKSSSNKKAEVLFSKIPPIKMPQQPIEGQSSKSEPLTDVSSISSFSAPSSLSSEQSSGLVYSIDLLNNKTSPHKLVSPMVPEKKAAANKKRNNLSSAADFSSGSSEAIVHSSVLFSSSGSTTSGTTPNTKQSKVAVHRRLGNSKVASLARGNAFIDARSSSNTLLPITTSKKPTSPPSNSPLPSTPKTDPEDDLLESVQKQQHSPGSYNINKSHKKSDKIKLQSSSLTNVKPAESLRMPIEDEIVHREKSIQRSTSFSPLKQSPESNKEQGEFLQQQKNLETNDSLVKLEENPFSCPTTAATIAPSINSKKENDENFKYLYECLKFYRNQEQFLRSMEEVCSNNGSNSQDASSSSIENADELFRGSMLTEADLIAHQQDLVQQQAAFVDRASSSISLTATGSGQLAQIGSHDEEQMQQEQELINLQQPVIVAHYSNAKFYATLLAIICLLIATKFYY